MTNGKVTPKELYETINALGDRMDDHFESLRKEMMDCYNSNAKRIGTIELWRSNLEGKIALVGAGFILISNVIVEFVKDKFLGRK